MAEQPTRDHVRRPDLPWRASRMTECGKPVADVKSYIDRPELLARLRADGVRRTAYSTCMTCLETSRRWPEWSDDPVGALQREFLTSRPDPALRDELRALAALVAEHRDEFDGYMQGLTETVSLADARRARARRGA